MLASGVILTLKNSRCEPACLIHMYPVVGPGREDGVPGPWRGHPHGLQCAGCVHAAVTIWWTTCSINMDVARITSCICVYADISCLLSSYWKWRLHAGAVQTEAATGKAAGDGEVAGGAEGKASCATGPALAVRSSTTPPKLSIRLNCFA